LLVVATEEGRVAAGAEDAGADGDAAAAAAGDAAAAAAGDAAAAEVEAGATAAGVLLITVGAVVHQAIRSVSKISHSQASNNPVGAYSCSQWFQIGR